MSFGFLFALVGMGCSPDSISPADGGTGGNGDAAAGVTYTKDVQPIFMTKCSPCHTGQMLGGHDIGTTYADALKPVTSVDSQGCWNDPDMTMPKKIGECASILIQSGQMPLGAGCGSAQPITPSMCLSAAQKQTVMAWVAAGLPQ